jgi:hypothetical protein
MKGAGRYSVRGRGMAKSSANSGAGVATARTLAPHARIEQRLAGAATPEIACAEMADLFSVGRAEVALLRAEHDVLNFLFPMELKAAGFIPLSSASAVAARTASSRKIELFNNFVIVQHANVFETIKLSTLGQSNKPGANTIQKLMTTPVVDPQQRVLGVIQICRKGITQDDAGPDFTLNDLQNLEAAARVFAKLPFMNSASN